MRLRTQLAVTAVALTSAMAGGPVLAADAARAAAGTSEPTCASTHRADFPISTRIHEAPATYHPGGGFRDWSLDLTNTTGTECAGIHPVLVLVDEKRTLAPRQIRLEFSDGKRRHPVRFERTGRDENVGVFDDGFPGFRVGPGETVTVEARLTFTSDARPNAVVANAAVVQRRDDDGDWVGESGDYRFTLTDDGQGAERRGKEDEGLRDTGTPNSRDTKGTDTTPGTGTGMTPGTGTSATPGTDMTPGTGTGTDTTPGTGTDTTPGTADHPDRGGRPLSPGELARTGPRSLRELGAASAALLVGGAALVIGSRRLRTGRR